MKNGIPISLPKFKKSQTNTKFRRQTSPAMTSLFPVPSPVDAASPPPPVIISTASPPVPVVTNSSSFPPPSPDSNSTVSTPPLNNSTAPPPSNGSVFAGAPPSPSTHKLPPGALAGLIVGIALGAISVLIAGGIFFILYRRKKKRETEGRLGGPSLEGSKGDFHTTHPQLWGHNYHPSTDNNAMSLPKPTPPPGIYQSPVPGHVSHQPSTHSSLGSDKPFASPSPGVVGISLGTFTYEELATATNGFSEANLIGQGGFGYVHKGVLRDGRVVAIKQLKAGSGQGEREFQAEIEIINRVLHQHLVSLFGYCIMGAQRMLVYEFVSNQTLEFHLHGKGRPTMNWSTRMKIAIGSAKGLAYLHEECQPKIIHRDIKAANILLDDNFDAKVADFGLAKFSADTDTHVSTRVMGTFGYLAPEYASSGKLTEKSDVFSFGVVLLELITGRRPVDRTQSFVDDSIVEWARPLLKQALEDKIYDPFIDPKLEDYDSDELTRMIACAAACIRHSARLRPQMSQVIRALEGTMPIDELNDGITPGHSTVFSSYGSMDYNSLQYKEDLKKFRKIALESQELGSSEFSGATSEYGVQPSASSTEGQQTTQEMEMQRKESVPKDSHENS